MLKFLNNCERFGTVYFIYSLFFKVYWTQTIDGKDISIRENNTHWFTGTYFEYKKELENIRRPYEEAK